MNSRNLIIKRHLISSLHAVRGNVLSGDLNFYAQPPAHIEVDGTEKKLEPTLPLIKL